MDAFYCNIFDSIFEYTVYLNSSLLRICNVVSFNTGMMLLYQNWK